MNIPTTEPASLRAGDTITWQITLSDYPASAWTLKYRLLNSAGSVAFTAVASGADHLVEVAAATTAAWTAGDYDYVAWVESAGERYTIRTGRITVLPDLSAATSNDGRSSARMIYEGLLAAYQAAVTSRAFVAEYQIADRRMKFSTRAEWLTELNFWKSQVAAEDRAAKLADGLGGARVLVRF